MLITKTSVPKNEDFELYSKVESLKNFMTTVEKFLLTCTEKDKEKLELQIKKLREIIKMYDLVNEVQNDITLG